MSTIMISNIGIKDFKKIKKIAKKTKCKIKIEQKKGLPFTFYKYKKRKLFFVMLIVFLIAMFTLSNFIWNIDITGNETIPSEEIKKILDENNFKLGTCKIGIETKEIINQLRLNREDIAWVGIEINGTNATIKIVEADKKPDIINEEDYCNIVATKEGIITKVSARNGTPVIKEGDVVTKGSVLVGGWLEGKYTGTRYVHANGEVQARVWYTQKEKVDFKQLQKKETGEVESRYSVNINNFKINLYKGVSKFKNYDTIEETKKLKIFSNLYLPIEWNKITNKEYQEVEVTYTETEAKAMAQKIAEEKLNEQIENKEKIVDKKINVTKSSTYIEVEVTYEVLENIATKEKIVF